MYDSMCGEDEEIYSPGIAWMSYDCMEFVQLLGFAGNKLTSEQT
jgi:hypothetical protein